jgi:hypothetical protein
MIRSFLNAVSVGLVAGLIVLTASSTIAQTTNQPPAKPNPSEDHATPKHVKKSGAGPFHGKLSALDKQAKTITVGKRTFQITSETKISKGAKPATLDEGVVGEPASGYVKPGADGKLIATKVNFGPKPVETAKKTPAQKEQK